MLRGWGASAGTGMPHGIQLWGWLPSLPHSAPSQPPGAQVSRELALGQEVEGEEGANGETETEG